MNKTSRTTLLKSAVLVVSALLIVSCQPQATQPLSTPVAQVTQDSGNPQDVRVNSAVPTETRVDSEEFPLPNCGGTGEIHQTLGAFASVFKSVTVGAKATVKGGGEVEIPEVAKLKLEIEVETAYQQTYESVSSRLDTIDMPAAAGTHVVYIIGWYEQTYESIVEYSADGKVHEAPYTYKLRIPKVENSYQLACAGNNSGNGGLSSNPPTPQPTAPLSTSGRRWEQEVAQVPTSGTQLKWELAAEQLLFLSGGQIRVNGEYCGGDAEQICIVIYTATTAQTVVADALIPENNWYGVSTTLSPEEALSEKEPQFWYQPNCIDGCRKATVLFFTDGQLVNKTTLTP